MNGEGARMVEMWSVDVGLRAAETWQTIVTDNRTRCCHTLHAHITLQHF